MTGYRRPELSYPAGSHTSTCLSTPSESDRTLSDGRVLVGDPDDVQRAADEGRLDDFREAAGS